MLFAVVAALTALTARSVPAAERRCPAVNVEADAGVRAVFPDVVECIHGEFTARSDVDTCARVALRLRDDDDIEVSVALPDGRTSSRTVTDAEDVVPTLQALLLIPVPAPESQAVPAEASPLIIAPQSTARVDDTSGSKRGVPKTNEREFGVELSVLTGARAGDAQVAYGAGALSLVEVERWLFGFEGRVDAYQSTSGSDPESALELAVLLGRRVYFDGVALDLTLGPAAAMKGIAPLSQTDAAPVDPSRTTRPPPPGPEPTTGPLPRLLVGARLGFAPHSVFRAFLGFEGELGPSQGTDDPSEVERSEVSSPRLPRYTAGLVAGVTVGTL
jgi:hypothetical protein